MSEGKFRDELVADTINHNKILQLNKDADEGKDVEFKDVEGYHCFNKAITTKFNAFLKTDEVVNDWTDCENKRILRNKLRAGKEPQDDGEYKLIYDTIASQIERRQVLKIGDRQFDTTHFDKHAYKNDSDRINKMKVLHEALKKHFTSGEKVDWCAFAAFLKAAEDAWNGMIGTVPDYDNNDGVLFPNQKLMMQAGDRQRTSLSLREKDDKGMYSMKYVCNTPSPCSTIVIRGVPYKDQGITKDAYLKYEGTFKMNSDGVIKDSMFKGSGNIPFSKLK